MRKYKKRANIIISAIKMFANKGFYNTKTSDISNSLNISVGSIYNYFTSKETLAKASIKYVTNSLANELAYINNKKVSQKEKINQFVLKYLSFIESSPEMIEYFFSVYLSHREIFCDEEGHCGFYLAKNFIDELEKLITDGVSSGEFKKIDFEVAFAIMAGTLGGITFLNSEKALKKDIVAYADELSSAIYSSLANTSRD